MSCYYSEVLLVDCDDWGSCDDLGSCDDWGSCAAWGSSDGGTVGPTVEAVVGGNKLNTVNVACLPCNNHK